MNSTKDIYFMRQALALARVAGNRTAPNPLVGAVIVRDGRVLARGYHRQCGGAHAEVDALRALLGSDARGRQLGGRAVEGSRAAGATMYVTLEPCNHYGKTPPCTEAIVESGISRVVVALRDPNPGVCGGGIEALRSQGVDVTVGVCEEEARQMNRAWIFSLLNNRSLVTLKLALSFDGKIAYADNSQRWLSSEISRAQVQRMRAMVHAVLIGSGTAIADNPLLTCRIPGKGQPLRVVVDSSLRSPLSLHLFQNITNSGGEQGVHTLVATTDLASPSRVEELRSKGVEVLICPSTQVDLLDDRKSENEDVARVDLRFLLEHLYKLGKYHVLCEGGAELGAQLFRDQLCDELVLYQAPIWLGELGVPFHTGTRPISLASNLTLQGFRTVGKDLVLHFQSTALRELRKVRQNKRSK